MSYADSVLAAKSVKVNFRTLASLITHEGCDVVLPRDSVRTVQDKLANTLYGYILGDRVAYTNLTPDFSASDHHLAHYPYRHGVTYVRAGTREPCSLSHPGKDEKTHLVYENGCFRQDKGCGNHCGYLT
ncbi:hypothetical protein HanRHA438_Chr09g0377681 [Helianthus annuus]|uniref:Uncharacterized protein n=1 Tax=Helianthus annuus TaxID=4232 RepID=A0A251TS10_HELAN|nr:hypothetical protein HanXRQr2_Chr09g0366601 [Helianthus annuus]KAJ0886296.1 hypothetical protein HanRHA438_Chr09g0377681 [Helianthus annuus]